MRDREHEARQGSASFLAASFTFLARDTFSNAKQTNGLVERSEAPSPTSKSVVKSIWPYVRILIHNEICKAPPMVAFLRS